MSTLERRSAAARTTPSTAPVNEWGVYDPAVAGIEALFARVDPDGLRRQREREPNPRRRPRRKTAHTDTSGVGLAIRDAVARARQQSPVALSPAEVAQQMAGLDARPAAVEAAQSRQPRSHPAIWLRAVEAVGPRPETDTVHGIFGTLAIPATVALVQYARGCRIGTIHIPGE